MGFDAMARRKFKYVSLFSGALGFDLGIERTGQFELAACVEKEEVFCRTIRQNNCAGRIGTRNLRVYNQDIRDLQPERLAEDIGLQPGELDLLIGGPPCQTFSTAGKRAGVQDPRGTLLWDFLRFVEYLQPKFFVLENVRGLVSARVKHRPIQHRPEKGGPPLLEEETPGSVLRLFMEDLRRLDVKYRADGFEVNAVNYGAPQLRERFILIGNRYGIRVDFPAPTHDPPDGNNRLFEARPPFRTLGDAIKGLDEPCPEVLDFSPRKKHYLSMVPPGGNWRSLDVETQRESMGKAFYAKGGRSGWWRRLSYDLPCPTVVTMPNHASTSLCHPEHIRALSVLECAAVQGFPRDWEFMGTVQEKYAQVGNAVPVRLGHVTGRVVADALEQSTQKCSILSPIRKDPLRIVYLRSHVRTRCWFKAGQALVWRDGGKNEGKHYRRPSTERRVRRLA